MTARALDGRMPPSWLDKTLLNDLGLGSLLWKTSFGEAMAIPPNTISVSDRLLDRAESDPIFRLPIYHELAHLRFGDDVATRFNKRVEAAFRGTAVIAAICCVVGLLGGGAGLNQIAGSVLLLLFMVTYAGSLLLNSRACEYAADLIAIVAADAKPDDLAVVLGRRVEPGLLSAYPTTKTRISHARKFLSRVDGLAVRDWKLEDDSSAVGLERHIKSHISRSYCFVLLAGIVISTVVVAFSMGSWANSLVREVIGSVIILGVATPMYLLRLLHSGFASISYVIGGLTLVIVSWDRVNKDPILSSCMVVGPIILLAGILGIYVHGHNYLSGLGRQFVKSRFKSKGDV